MISVVAWSGVSFSLFVLLLLPMITWFLVIAKIN